MKICLGLDFALTPQGDAVAFPFVVFPVPSPPPQLAFYDQSSIL